MEEPKLPKLYPKDEKTKKKWKPKVYTQNESLNKFNKNCMMTFAFDEKEIDLTNLETGPGKYLARDLSRIRFDECEKLVMSMPTKYVKDLYPRMPKLKYFGLVYGDMLRFFLRTHAFQNVETLDLTGNEISKADSISGAKRLPKLKTLILIDNPICCKE